MFRLVPERILNAKNLVVGDSATFDVPLDKKGWFLILLELAITLAVGTGTTAKSEGELNIYKNITFETDLDKESHNAPARAFFRYGQFAQRNAPTKDAIAATDGTYRTMVPLLFGDPLSRDPVGTILDARRYETAQVKVQLGTVADLLGTPGTAAISAATLSAVALKTNYDLPVTFSPKAYRYFKGLQAVNHTDLELKVRRVPDLRLRRLLYMLAQSSVAGVPFSGTPGDSGITNIKFDVGNTLQMNTIPRRMLADDNQRFYQLASRPAGWNMLDFMPEGDPDESLILHPDVISKASMLWDTDDATATTVNALLDCQQLLKV